VRIGEYLTSFMSRCPGLPLTLEVIVMPAPRRLPFRTPAFWDGYRRTPAWEFQRFLDLLDDAVPVALPEGTVDRPAELENAERSVEWLRSFVADQPPRSLGCS
jgi:hypothetical protein